MWVTRVDVMIIERTIAFVVDMIEMDRHVTARIRRGRLIRTSNGLFQLLMEKQIVNMFAFDDRYFFGQQEIEMLDALLKDGTEQHHSM